MINREEMSCQIELKQKEAGPGQPGFKGRQEEARRAEGQLIIIGYSETYPEPGRLNDNFLA
jgi:hypothetical protein